MDHEVDCEKNFSDLQRKKNEYEHKKILDWRMVMSGMFEEIYQGILDGDRESVIEGVKSALESKVSAESILKEGMMTAMAEVGRLFEEGEYFVPELLVAARAMQGGLDILKPLLVAEDVECALPSPPGNLKIFLRLRVGKPSRHLAMAEFTWKSI